ncbi:MAG: glycoside hydrolase family 172 protein [Bacteroidales bacterium]
MKVLFSVVAGLSLLLTLGFSSCNTGYRTDIQHLLSPAALPYLKSSKLIQVSSSDTSGGNNDRISIGPGKKVNIFDAEGPGMIVRIWFAIDSRDPYFLRRIVLRIFWDNESKPSVEVPLGDFFGCGFKYKPYVSQYLGMSSGGYVCYFPMPFERSARIEIANETRQNVDGFLYQVDYQKFEGALESDVAYFHAQWTRSIRTNYDSNFVLLRAEGKGHLVGVNLNIQSYDGRLGFLEGDEMIYVDGEKKPSVHGTGTEDLFSAGWYFNQGEFAGPYSGLVYKNDSIGQISAYRFYIMDPIPFKKNIKVTIEHGHGNQDIADYSSTAYWYQMEPHASFPSFPIAGQRIPLRIVKPARMYEAEKLKFTLEGLKSRVVDMSDEGPEWGENRQIVIESRNKSSFGLDINGLKESVYDLNLYYSRGPEYGNADIFVNGVMAGKINGYSPYILPNGKVTMLNLKNQRQSIEIRFVVTGKDPLSKSFFIGLDGVSMEPKRVYIPEWYILGPFSNPRKIGLTRRGLDSVYAPETNINLATDYHSAAGKPIRWSYLQTPESGLMSLVDKVNPHELVVTYALTYIYSPDNSKTTLFVGTDDGGKVFFNDKEVFRYLGERVAEPDQAEIELMMKPGWNKLLLKIENNYGAYSFYARLIDTGNKLVISANQKLPSEKRQ